MRHLLIVLAVLIGTISTNAQADSTELVLDNPEVQPQFPGGIDSLQSFIEHSNNWQAGRETIVGKVFVGFVVEQDGSVSNIEILKGLHENCDQEAERIVGLLPNWKPGELNGKPVRTKMIIPIIFDGMK